MNKPGIPVEIGGDPKVSPRVACPYCAATSPRELKVGDFALKARSEVAQAMMAGATLYECASCAKRYAVQSARPKGYLNRHARRRLAAVSRGAAS